MGIAEIIQLACQHDDVCESCGRCENCNQRVKRRIKIEVPKGQREIVPPLTPPPAVPLNSKVPHEVPFSKK